MAETVEFQLTTPEPFWTNIQHPENFRQYVEPAMSNIMDEFKAEMEVYAPESEANRPGRRTPEGEPIGYYERGIGWWEPIKQPNYLNMLASAAGARGGFSGAKFGKPFGVIKGGRKFGVVGYHLTSISQQMGERWVTAIESNQDSIVGTLFNGASYSGLVQGTEQTALHASRDWSTIDSIWTGDPMQETLDKEIGGALDQLLAG